MKPDFRRNLLYVAPNGQIKMLKCIAVIIRDAITTKNLILAFMNEEAWLKTKETGFVHLWLTSEDRLWFKGETSGNKMEVVYKRLNCDCTSMEIGVKVLGDGAACHTGKISCFYNRVL